MNAEERLVELGLQLPPPAEPKGLYRPVVIVGELAYTSGHLPIDGGKVVTGCVGRDLDVEGGAQAARLVGLGMLASLRAALGSLDRVRRVVKVLGVVRSTEDFTQQPAVINGFSQLLADVFGAETGMGARGALGTSSLPLGVPVEIEAVFEIER